MTVRLDDLDRQLLALLRSDGRAPVSKLADILGVTRGTIQARIDRMLAQGAILGFTVRAREEHDGSSVRAIMLIEVTGKSTSAIVRRLRGFPEIHKLHTTNGAWDLVAEISAASLQDFDRVLREVRTIDGVLNSQTSILLTAV